jgi:hypothetical protein
MNTAFGLRGAIVPPGPFKGKTEAFTFQGFPIEIEDGVIAIGFNDQSLADQARAIVRQHLAWFSAEHGIRHVAELNRSWERKPDGTTAVHVVASDTIRVQFDLRTQVSIPGRARIVAATYDSAALATYSGLTEKSLRSDALRDAVAYFSDEAIDDDRPLYGIYKAIEALTAALPDSRGELGMLAGCTSKKAGKEYVDAVMQTAQLTRHHNDPNAQRVLTDEECRSRAKVLLDAFSKSV